MSSNASCTVGTTTYDEPGTGDCYQGQQKSGSWYYFTVNDTIVFGKLGQAWRSGPSGVTDSVMRAEIGC